MSSPRTVLVTGPVRGLEEYCAAVWAADWVGLSRPLVVIEEIDPAFELPSDTALERILITSGNAVASLDQLASKFLELREVPCSVVGERTRRVLEETGFTVDGESARDASELAARLAEELPAASSILWPRGSLSDQLAVDLRTRGHWVLDPVVYRTAPSADSSPTHDTNAVFFASPSAVRAWRQLPHRRDTSQTIAIAIGATTHAELASETAESFSAILTLAQPTPEELTRVLRELSNSES